MPIVPCSKTEVYFEGAILSFDLEMPSAAYGTATPRQTKIWSRNRELEKSRVRESGFFKNDKELPGFYSQL